MNFWVITNSKNGYIIIFSNTVKLWLKSTCQWGIHWDLLLSRINNYMLLSFHSKQSFLNCINNNFPTLIYRYKHPSLFILLLKYFLFSLFSLCFINVLNWNITIPINKFNIDNSRHFMMIFYAFYRFFGFCNIQ